MRLNSLAFRLFASAAAWTLVVLPVTAILLKVLDLTMGLRVKEDEEELGLDVTQHGERGYVFDETGAVAMAQIVQAPPAPSSAPVPQPKNAMGEA